MCSAPACTHGSLAPRSLRRTRRAARHSWRRSRIPRDLRARRAGRERWAAALHRPLHRHRADPAAQRGDPCLNYLHFPAHTLQTPHHHPSQRGGLVYDGEGLCHTRAQTMVTRPGSMWLIPAGLEHWFQTNDSALRILAFIPTASSARPTRATSALDNYGTLSPESVKSITYVRKPGYAPY
jgi:mannose-6-phosphate isomerase-like protein (cupin superfamily)